MLVAGVVAGVHAGYCSWAGAFLRGSAQRLVRRSCGVSRGQYVNKWVSLCFDFSDDPEDEVSVPDTPSQSPISRGYVSDCRHIGGSGGAVTSQSPISRGYVSDAWIMYEGDEYPRCLNPLYLGAMFQTGIPALPFCPAARVSIPYISGLCFRRYDWRRLHCSRRLNPLYLGAMFQTARSNYWLKKMGCNGVSQFFGPCAS